MRVLLFTLARAGVQEGRPRLTRVARRLTVCFIVVR